MGPAVAKIQLEAILGRRFSGKDRAFPRTEAGRRPEASRGRKLSPGRSRVPVLAQPVLPEPARLQPLRGTLEHVQAAPDRSLTGNGVENVTQQEGAATQ